MKSLSILGLSLAALLAGCSGSSSGSSAPVPPPERNRTSPALVGFGTEPELLAALTGAALRRSDALLEYHPASIALAAPTFTPPPASSGGYSGTNNQETGVDEPDIVKTDGRYIDLLNGDRLEILGVPQAGELTHVATLAIEGQPLEMLLHGDRAVVFSTVDIDALPAGHPMKNAARRILVGNTLAYRMAAWTKVTAVDLTDPANPVVTDELYLEAAYQTARQVAGAVRMIGYSEFEPQELIAYLPVVCGVGSAAARAAGRAAAIAGTKQHNREVLAKAQLSDFVPDLYELMPNGRLVSHDLTGQGGRSFFMAEDAISSGITSILTLGLDAGQPLESSTHIVTNPSHVYASADTLLVAEPTDSWWWYFVEPSREPATNLHRFDIAVPGTTTYTGSGRVDGTVRDAFSLSEHGGFVRVVSTTGTRGPSGSLDSHLSVLEGKRSLDVVGEVRGIGGGETVWSCRFLDDEAFVITYRAIDPLWAIDLSDPYRPRIAGELEVEGVSTYIHPLVADGRLLTVGRDPNFQANVSLFDVRNFVQPVLDDRLTLSVARGGGWSPLWTETLTDHRAFTYWEPARMLALPVNTQRVTTFANGYSNYENVSTLELIRVDPSNGSLTPYGSIDHAPYFSNSPKHRFRTNAIRRSIFMDHYVYAVSDRAVTVNDLDTMTQTAVVQLPGSGT